MDSPVPTPVPAAASSQFPWRALFGRSLALALGLFCACNLVGSLGVRDFDATLWLLDLRPLPHRLALALVALLGAALLFLGLGGSGRSLRLGRAARFAAYAGAAVALFNAAVCWKQWLVGASASSFPLPFSIVVAAGLVVAGAWSKTGKRGPTGPQQSPSRRVRRTVLFIFLLTPGAFVSGCALILLQLTLFGLTDYRAPADVAVIYGARAYPDGRCSNALEDRVLAGVALYKQGLASKLLMSGGPVAGAKPGQVQDEPEAMRRFAMSKGVPAEAILLDPLGVSTVGTAESTARLAREHGWKRILAVSHFYHLSRAKLTMQRAGVGRQAQVRTVPAPMRGRVLARLPWYMVRELGAFLKDFAAPKRAEGTEGTQE